MNTIITMQVNPLTRISFPVVVIVAITKLIKYILYKQLYAFCLQINILYFILF